jgi:hypothetical protein
MSNEEAKRVRNNYKRRLARLNAKVRTGDNEAALNVIKVLTERNIALKKLGYQIGDEGELEKITPAVIRREKAKQTEMDKLVEKARKDPTKIAEVIRKMAKG